MKATPYKLKVNENTEITWYDPEEVMQEYKYSFSQVNKSVGSFFHHNTKPKIAWNKTLEVNVTKYLHIRTNKKWLLQNMSNFEILSISHHMEWMPELKMCKDSNIVFKMICNQITGQFEPKEHTIIELKQ